MVDCHSYFTAVHLLMKPEWRVSKVHRPWAYNTYSTVLTPADPVHQAPGDGRSAADAGQWGPVFRTVSVVAAMPVPVTAVG